MLTCFDVTIDQAQQNAPVAKKALRPSFIESILGKRTSKQAIKKTEVNAEDDDENIVSKVESNPDFVTFDKPEKKRRDPNQLPKSLIERYGSEIKLSKKEQRRLHVSKAKETQALDGE